MVAAGSGVRLGGDGPKALRSLAGIPLVVWAVRTLLTAGLTRVVVVVPAQARARFEEVLTSRFGPDGGWSTAAGGAERQDSVRAGLTALADAASGVGAPRTVLVHDAARPLVPLQVVQAVVAAVAAGERAVVPVVPVVDSIRQLQDDGSVIVDRTRLRAVQTPQGFDFATLLSAHRAVAAAGRVITDDAAACEFVDVPIALVPGSRRSIKITEPVDLRLAELLLADDEGE